MLSADQGHVQSRKRTYGKSQDGEEGLVSGVMMQKQEGKGKGRERERSEFEVPLIGEGEVRAKQRECSHSAEAWTGFRSS